MRISDWSSDVCSSDLQASHLGSANIISCVDQVEAHLMQFLLGIQQVDERAGSHLHILQPIKLPGFGHARLASIEDVKDAAQTFNLTPRLCELSAHLVTADRKSTRLNSSH